jgi:hypothetical protein
MIIGLSGYARSGKDTTAGMLIGLHGYDNRAFASGVRELLLAINPILENGHRINEVVTNFNWEIAKAQSETRRLLQELGLNARKFFGDDVWVQRAMVGVKPGDKVVFTDVRFPNEAQTIKDLGGAIWRIQRPGVIAINNHPSESAMDDWKFDKIIVNNTGLDGLKKQIASCLA